MVYPAHQHFPAAAPAAGCKPQLTAVQVKQQLASLSARAPRSPLNSRRGSPRTFPPPPPHTRLSSPGAGPSGVAPTPATPPAPQGPWAPGAPPLGAAAMDTSGGGTSRPPTSGESGRGAGAGGTSQGGAGGSGGPGRAHTQQGVRRLSQSKLSVAVLNPDGVPSNDVNRDKLSALKHFVLWRHIAFLVKM